MPGGTATGPPGGGSVPAGVDGRLERGSGNRNSMSGMERNASRICRSSTGETPAPRTTTRPPSRATSTGSPRSAPNWWSARMARSSSDRLASITNGLSSPARTRADGGRASVRAGAPAGGEGASCGFLCAGLCGRNWGVSPAGWPSQGRRITVAATSAVADAASAAQRTKGRDKGEVRAAASIRAKSGERSLHGWGGCGHAPLSR